MGFAPTGGGGFATGIQNLELSVAPQINSVVPKQSIDIYIWKSQTNVKGVMTATYNVPVSTMASIQQENSQNLQHLEGVDLSEIFYRFYIQSDIVSGLNRVEGKAQDFIFWNNRTYTIFQVFDGFKTGWKYVVAVENSDNPILNNLVVIVDEDDEQPLDVIVDEGGDPEQLQAVELS